MNKTKIICTVGPSCASEEVLEKMIQSGMNVARLNMSHNNNIFFKKIIVILKNLSEKLKKPLAIMVDLKGSKFRTGKLRHDFANLKNDQQFILTTRKMLGTEKIVSIDEDFPIDKLKENQKIYIDDGKITLKVESKTKNQIICKVICGGKLTSKKSINIPSLNFERAFFSKEDENSIKFGIKNNVDYFALSFVNNANDILKLKNFLKLNGGLKIKIISKIENNKGVSNIKSITKNCDGVMVARGDLGVEIGFDKVPMVQKKIVECALKNKKIAIVSTQMLNSMTHQSIPTRAEVSDVALAVMQNASALMLSNETAVGNFPIKTTETMGKIIQTTQRYIKHKLDKKISNVILKNKNIKQICVKTNKFKFANYLSFNLAHLANILILTSNENLYNQSALMFGIDAKMIDEEMSINELKDLFSKNKKQKNIVFINEKLEVIN